MRFCQELARAISAISSPSNTSYPQSFTQVHDVVEKLYISVENLWKPTPQSRLQHSTEEF
jgi:hypothetical protein